MIVIYRDILKMVRNANSVTQLVMNAQEKIPINAPNVQILKNFTRTLVRRTVRKTMITIKTPMSVINVITHAKLVPTTLNMDVNLV
jgi:hypothetical protein